MESNSHVQGSTDNDGMDQGKEQVDSSSLSDAEVSKEQVDPGHAKHLAIIGDLLIQRMSDAYWHRSRDPSIDHLDCMAEAMKVLADEIDLWAPARVVSPICHFQAKEIALKIRCAAFAHRSYPSTIAEENETPA